MRTIRAFLLALAVAGSASAGEPAVWQWSAPAGGSEARLWIPENCRKVRAVLLAQHNMIERGILEHPAMRRTLADCGIAEVFIAPSMDAVFRFDQGASDKLDAALKSLADQSGYDEIANAPLIPMGHSAHASFPWNCAAWKPGRTLAVLSVKGDAPLTNLTGSGRPNPDWGNQTLDGIPGLMVMSEYEWWEARLAPLRDYLAKHPAAPIGVLADAGHGHFDATDSLVEFLALFIRKAAAARLPEDGSNNLRAVDPSKGWLVDRWRRDETPRAHAAPHSSYSGDKNDAFWCFDEETARATETRHASGRGGKITELGFIQNGGFVPISNTHAGTELTFQPETDGITFQLDSDFITPLPKDPPTATKDKRPPPTRVTPVAAAEGSHAAGKPAISRIIGPVVPTESGTFQISLDWMFPATNGKPIETWFLTSHSGNSGFKGVVRQAMMRVQPCAEGTDQTLTFPEIPDQHAGAEPIALTVTSGGCLPVSYYVREGPAVIRGGQLHLTPLPPRAKHPVKITVVAWQFGRPSPPAVKAAAPVTRTFSVLR